jgi:hypothetical protein
MEHLRGCIIFRLHSPVIYRDIGNFSKSWAYAARNPMNWPEAHVLSAQSLLLCLRTVPFNFGLLSLSLGLLFGLNRTCVGVIRSVFEGYDMVVRVKEGKNDASCDLCADPAWRRVSPSTSGANCDPGASFFWARRRARAPISARPVLTMTPFPVQ